MKIVEFTTDKKGNYVECKTGKPVPKDVERQLKEGEANWLSGIKCECCGEQEVGLGVATDGGLFTGCTNTRCKYGNTKENWELILSMFGKEGTSGKRR